MVAKVVKFGLKRRAVKPFPADGPIGDWEGTYPRGTPTEPRGSVLLKIKFHRIILDEMLAKWDYNSFYSRTMCMLRGYIRWALRSSSIQMNESEIYPYLRFLRHSPFDHRQV